MRMNVISGPEGYSSAENTVLSQGHHRIKATPYNAESKTEWLKEVGGEQRDDGEIEILYCCLIDFSSQLFQEPEVCPWLPVGQTNDLITAKEF